MLNSISVGSSLHSGKYRPDIDGLRAIAVSSVVVVHAFPSFLPGGFVGVDIFFVISGYLISSILLDDLEAQRFSLLRFYDRRIRRIFPALLTLMLAAAAIGWFILYRQEFKTLGAHLDASALFFENFKLWSESSYFDKSSESKPLLHLWSLAIEEQFYIFWPIILYLVRRKHVYFFVTLSVLGLASFAANIFYVNHDVAGAYYSPLGRFWELMLGALLAYLHKHHRHWLDRHHDLQSAVGLGLIAVSLVLINPTSAFPGFWALLPTIGAFLMLSAGGGAWINRRILSTTPFVWVGLISYPLYLWHWVFLSYGFILVGKMSPVLKVILVSLAAAAAVLTFLFIERPFRSRSGGFAQPLKLSAAMVVVLAVGGLIAVRAVKPRLDGVDAPTKNEWTFLSARSKDFDADNAGVYYLHRERANQVLFIGDSHIAQYAERIDKVIGADARLPGAIMAIGGGCIPIEGVYTGWLIRQGCWPVRDRAFQMAREDRFKTIVIGGAWDFYFLGQSGYSLGTGPHPLRVDTPAGQAAALAKLEQAISQLVKSGKRVILVLDNPRSPANDPLGNADSMFAKARWSFSADTFAKNHFVPLKPAQRDLRDRMATLGRQAGAIVVDPLAATCVSDQCRTTTETGQPLYWDLEHFNPDWSIDHADFIDVTVR